jgi:hypothetical protein
MPEWTTTQIDTSHDEAIGDFASDSAAQAWMRIIPEQIPSTHELKATWEPHPNPKHAPRLRIRLVRKEETNAATISGVPSSSTPAAGTQPADQGAEPGGADGDDGRVQAPADRPPALDPASVAELEKLPLADLKTRAAVVGVSIYVKGDKGRECSPAQLVARIAEKQAGK